MTRRRDAAAGRVHLESRGEGEVRVSGELRVDTVTQALAQGERLFADQPRLRLDMGGVTSADSAALALLAVWAGEARERGQSIAFCNLSIPLLHLAEMSGLDGPLGLRRRGGLGSTDYAEGHECGPDDGGGTELPVAVDG
jgi:phospholipid transport system transporter-binding protein